MRKKKSRLPNFNKMSYREEANWWDTHDLGDYWDEFKDVNLVFELHKPKEKTLVLRLSKNIKDSLEYAAKNKGVSVSSLARMWLVEKLQSSSPGKKRTKTPSNLAANYKHHL